MQKFNLSEIKDTDSFSLRLWTGSMFGNTLITFAKKDGRWDSHKYWYYSDTSINEIKNFADNIDDGTWYTLEVIRGKTYKVLQYHAPESFTESNNQKFSAVIKLIDKYFY